MGDKMVVMVTGVGSYWGRRLASRLLEEPGVAVIGLDAQAPVDEIPGLDFIQADIRSPLLAELLRSEDVSALCHLDFVSLAKRSEKINQRNVQGAIKVLEACAEAGVGRVVLKSSTAVYGAHPDNSAFLTEESALRGSKRYGYTRDLLDIEEFCCGYRDQRPEVTLTVLRFASVIGPAADSPLTQFLKQQTPPILLGFDPMLQLIHEDDVVEALAHATLNVKPGVFNVAAEDAMPLSRVLRLARRVPLPIFHRLAYRGLNLLRGSSLEPLRFVPIEWDYLRYPWIADLSRMRDELDFIPIYTAAESLRQFAGEQRQDADEDETAPDDDEQRLRDIIARRQRMRERDSNQ